MSSRSVIGESPGHGVHVDLRAVEQARSMGQQHAQGDLRFRIVWITDLEREERGELGVESSRFCSTSCIAATAIGVLEIEARTKIVSGGEQPR